MAFSELMDIWSSTWRLQLTVPDPGQTQRLLVSSDPITSNQRVSTLAHAFLPKQKLSMSAGAGVKDLCPQGLTGTCGTQALERTTFSTRRKALGSRRNGQHSGEAEGGFLEDEPAT